MDYGCVIAMCEVLLFIPQALFLMLPTYVANMTPVFFAKLFPRWDTPLDFGKLHKDGKPIFGKNKTWRGLICGSLVAMLFASGLALAVHGSGLAAFPDYGWSAYGSFWVVPVIGLFMGFGALAGDAVKSFFKRRRGKEPGAAWYGPDQLDFIVGSWLFALAAGGVLQLCGLASGNWFLDLFILGGNWPRAVFVAASILILHPLTNWIGYKLKLKKVPW